MSQDGRALYSHNCCCLASGSTDKQEGKQQTANARAILIGLAGRLFPLPLHCLFCAAESRDACRILLDSNSAS